MSVKIYGSNRIDLDGNNETFSIRATADDELNFYKGASTKLMGIDASGFESKPNIPAFLAKASTSYTGDGTTAGYELFQYTDVELNVGSYYDSTSTECKFTAPVSGNYLFSWWASASTGSQSSRYIRLQLFKNGSEYLNPHNAISDETNNNDYNLVGGTGIVPLTANDFVQIFWGSSIATDNIVFYSNMNFFSGYLIG